MAATQSGPRRAGRGHAQLHEAGAGIDSHQSYTSPVRPVDRLLDRLPDARRNGEGFTARCPAHADRTPSLSIAEGDDGRALVHCHAGCEHADVLAALDLGLEDLFPDRKPTDKPVIVKQYPYVDADGEVLFEVLRMSPKGFRQRRPDGRDGWVWNLKGVASRPLYRLPDVLAAVAAGQLVWITEGEKDADRLQRELPDGEVATTCPGGAGKWRPEHTATLAGAGVMVVADRDDPGRAHARAVARALADVAVSVSVIEPAVGKDASEHLDAGHGPDDFTALEVDVDFALVLDDVEALFSRYVAFPSEHARVAVVLWCAHTHVFDAFDSTPRLDLSSPEPGSGKTRCLEVAEQVVANGEHFINTTTAALFRIIDEETVTLLFDEADAVFGPRASSNYEDLRALINAGHRRGATVRRMVGEGAGMKPRAFNVFAPVALAGLGELPQTITDRSVVVRMKRRAPHETVEPFRWKTATAQGAAVRGRLEAWAETAIDQLRDAEPTMPPGLVDRPADVWEPLLAVAEAAGQRWTDRARAAATALTSTSTTDVSLGQRLLGEIRDVFDQAGTDRLRSSDLVHKLRDLPEAPWAGRVDLNQAGLARLLKPYEVRPVDVRFDDGTKRGYRRSDFEDAWTRYLGTPPEKGTTGATHDGPTTEHPHEHGPVAPVAPVAPSLVGVPTVAPHGHDKGASQ